jgi:tRNA threonylcarbamoyladenosine biosynthesis protein TsaE
MINDLIIQHYDLFKLKDSNEIKNIGLFENYSSIITFVEWPEVIEEKPEKRTDLLFNYEDNLTKRSLIISSTYKKKLMDEFK